MPINLGAKISCVNAILSRLRKILAQGKSSVKLMIL
jgi:hypothetical protein